MTFISGSLPWLDLVLCVVDFSSVTEELIYFTELRFLMQDSRTVRVRVRVASVVMVVLMSSGVGGQQRLPPVQCIMSLNT